MNSTIMKNTIRIGAILLLGTAPFLRADMSFQVTVDTTPLAGVAGYMAFDLFGGVPLQDNVSTITSFATTGTLLAGASTSGDVSGSLTPGPLVETADMDFNEWLQPITFGSGLTTFDVDLTTFATSDPLGADRLFAIDLVGADTMPDVFTSTFATTTVTASGSAVPEPNLLPLAFLGFGLMLAVHAIVSRARIARS
jgi:hypothetical protein